MILKLLIKLKNRFFLFFKKVYLIFYALEFKSFGNNNSVWFPIKIYGKENVSIGNNCGLNAFLHIWGQGGVVIGNNVMIASHVSITSLTHDYLEQDMRHSNIIKKEVIIEDNVWIGSGAIILPGIRIGRGAVIGAGSVVTKDVLQNTIVVGNPSRVLKTRGV
jgi:acetyltransferase-like isoleucine patch superfamily enzyme